MNSMTGFGRGEAQDESKKFIVELKTVNHRYTDIFIKMPRQLSYVEDKVRELISKSLSRGKVDVYISSEDYGENPKYVFVDEGLAKAYVEAVEKIRDKYSLQDDLSVSLISKFPDVLRVEKTPEDEDKIWSLLKNALMNALDALIKMREAEGEQLRISILERISGINSIVNEIEARSPEVVVEYRIRLNNRIKEILAQDTVDENRLATEIAIFADRCSIDEEIVRLKSHFSQLRETLYIELPIGRKLDFLIQEINREANTIGSKSNDLIITRNVIELKSEIEKIREQVQNIE